MSTYRRTRVLTTTAIALLLLVICLVVGNKLGFFWLILIGLMVADASVDGELSHDTRLGRWLAERVYGPQRVSLEQTAAIAEERHTVIERLHIWKYFGLLVAALGMVAFLGQLWLTET
jgi:hypothetical protein